MRPFRPRAREKARPHRPVHWQGRSSRLGFRHTTRTGYGNASMLPDGDQSTSRDLVHRSVQAGIRAETPQSG